jgi:hypothetical protein
LNVVTASDLGRLELWDFGASTLRPVVQHASTKCAMTALLFAKVSLYMY